MTKEEYYAKRRKKYHDQQVQRYKINTDVEYLCSLGAILIEKGDKIVKEKSKPRRNSKIL